GIAVDGSGSAYVVGSTTSTNLAGQGGFNGGGMDVFVAKMNPAGSALVYATYLGGTGMTDAFVTKLNASGTGLLYSTLMGGPGDAYRAVGAGRTFCITPGWFKQTCLDPNAFVAKLNASATALVYAGCLDAPGKDSAFGLALDRAENVYLTGFTQSAKFPIIDS